MSAEPLDVRVLHVVESFSQGGAGRALLATASACAKASVGVHKVASLTPAARPIVAAARSRGLEVIDAPSRVDLEAEVSAADIVQLHFWNSPALYEMVGRQLPALRLVIWSHVAGDRPPQVLTGEIAAMADRLVASCPYTAERFTAATLIEAFAELRGPEYDDRRGNGEFCIGHVGSLDEVKTHPEFVGLHAGLVARGARFVVCGDGDMRPRLEREAAALSLAGRFEWRGYVGEVGAALAEFDVFAYPLHPDFGEGGELALQEAMLAGVPPVVWAGAGATRTVNNGETGIVVDDAGGYVAAIDRLRRDLALRERLGANARRLAIERWAPARAVRAWRSLYASLLQQPKRRRAPIGASLSGCERFILSLGEAAGTAFEASRASRDEDAVLSAEALIATCGPQLRSPATGGILHYRVAHPEDPMLRLWAGLVLAGIGRHALATAEFAGAAAGGIDHWRVSWYLAQSAFAAGNERLGRHALERVPAGVRSCRPAGLAAHG